MELKISVHSSLRVPTIISQRCRASSQENNRLTQFKLTTKNIKSPLKLSTKDDQIPPIWLYSESRSSKVSIYGQNKRNSVEAFGQIESAGSDPVLDRTQDESVIANISRFGSAFFNFLRPVAMIQITLTSLSFFARMLVENPHLFKWSLVFKAVPGLIAVLLANSYNIGINQIFDVEIDRVNKPYLPIAAGDLSLKQAWCLVIFYLIAGLSTLRMMNADLIATSIYCLGLLLSTTYSAPPFRFKESPVTTSIVLPLVGSLLDVGMLYNARASLGLPFWWSPSIVFIMAFTTLHGIVISIMKDITDIEGDLKYNIRTFPVIFGPRNVTFFATGILLVNYVGAIAAAIYMPQAFKLHVMLPAHSILALCLLFQVKKLDNANYAKDATIKFYVSLWVLRMVELLLFPFM